MCCAFEEHNRCEKCSKIWNRESHHVVCANPMCRRDFNLSGMPPLVNTDTCLKCRMTKRRQQEAIAAVKMTVAAAVGAEEAETERRNSSSSGSSSGSISSSSVSSKGARKLTPLFWDSERNEFSDLWSSSDGSLEDDGWGSLQL